MEAIAIIEQPEAPSILVRQEPLTGIILVGEENIAIQTDHQTNIQFMPPALIDVSTETGVMEWFRKLPKLLQRSFLKVIHCVARPDVSNEIIAQKKRFAPWRSILIGNVTRRNFLRRFHKKAIGVSYWAKKALMHGSFVTSRKQRRIRLIIVSAVDLGLGERSTIADLIESMKPKRLAAWSAENLYGCRLSLCPAETSLHLLCQYKNQPEEECILIGSKPIMFKDGNAVMFAVEHSRNDNPSLQVMLIQPHRRLPSDLKIVFVLRRRRYANYAVCQNVAIESPNSA